MLENQIWIWLTRRRTTCTVPLICWVISGLITASLMFNAVSKTAEVLYSSFCLEGGVIKTKFWCVFWCVFQKDFLSSWFNALKYEEYDRQTYFCQRTCDFCLISSLKILWLAKIGENDNKVCWPFLLFLPVVCCGVWFMTAGAGRLGHLAWCLRGDLGPVLRAGS